LPVGREIRPSPAARNRPLRVRSQLWALFLFAATAQVAPAQQAPPAPSTQQPRFVVVLDAAHGGDDPGGLLLSGQPEKAFNLALNARLKSLLNARGFQVVGTRDNDVAVEPNRRAEIANRASAHACLILHASESGSGIHLFASQLAPAQPTRFTAWKAAQSAFVTRSLTLAGALNGALLHAGMTVTLGRTSLPALDSMTCPAVAVEIAPERDADQKTTAALDDPEYQARVAGALAAALVQWRAESWNSGARQP